ncbi:MAG: hypothetical protein EBS54_02025 [Betaproteobacteria bacterium]|nr:hypothetical protein [Betaproteobacteria bacterium]
MASYDQTPGTLNLSFKRGDDFSALVDFSISMTGYTATASMTSLVSGAAVQAFTTTFVSAANGQVNIALTDTQTASLARGTYGWSMAWTVDNATRTALTGFVEVL